MSVYDDYADTRIRLIGTTRVLETTAAMLEQEGHDVGWIRREVALSEAVLDATSLDEVA